MNMKKAKVKFNILDVFIILVLAAAFVAGLMFIGAKSPDGGTLLSIIGADSKNSVYYTVEIRSTPLTYKDNYSVGDRVYDSDTGNFLGIVDSVEAKPATTSVADTINGAFKLAEYEEKEDVYITLKAVPKIEEEGIIVGKHNIKVGKEMKIQKAGCVGEGYVVAVRTDTEGGARK